MVQEVQQSTAESIIGEFIQVAGTEPQTSFALNRRVKGGVGNGRIGAYLVQLDLEGSPASGFKGLSPLAHKDGQAEERSPKDLEWEGKSSSVGKATTR